MRVKQLQCAIDHCESSTPTRAGSVLHFACLNRGDGLLEVLLLHLPSIPSFEMAVATEGRSGQDRGEPLGRHAKSPALVFAASIRPPTSRARTPKQRSQQSSVPVLHALASTLPGFEVGSRGQSVRWDAIPLGSPPSAATTLRRFLSSP